MPKTKKINGIIINLIFLAVVLIILFTIVEVAVRVIIGPEKIINDRGELISISDGKLGYKFRPNFNGSFREIDFDTEFNTNSQGYRGPDFNASDKNVIFMLGDSFTAGHGVEYNETMSYLLQERLDNKYKTYNLGILGYSQKQHVVQLEELLPVYKPKIVVENIYLGNDVLDNCDTLLPTVDSKKSFPQKLESLIKESKFIVLVYKTFILPSKEPPELQFYIQDKDTEVCYNNTKALLGQIKNLSQKSNSKLLVVLIGREVQTSEEKNAHILSWYEKFSSYKNNKDAFDLDIFNKRVLQICKELSIECLDLTPTFKSLQGDFYVRDGHWNTKGHAIATEEVARFLKDKKYL